MKVFWCNSFLGSQVQATTLKCKWKCLLLLIRNQIQEYFNQIRKYLIQLACCYNMKGGSFHWCVQAEEVYGPCLLDNSDWFACVVLYRFSSHFNIETVPFHFPCQLNGKILKVPIFLPKYCSSFDNIFLFVCYF